jgi:hypothetical protein
MKQGSIRSHIKIKNKIWINGKSKNVLESPIPRMTNNGNSTKNSRNELIKLEITLLKVKISLLM